MFLIIGSFREVILSKIHRKHFLVNTGKFKEILKK